jgi:hypothetical protein
MVRNHAVPDPGANRAFPAPAGNQAVPEPAGSSEAFEARHEEITLGWRAPIAGFVGALAVAALVLVMMNLKDPAPPSSRANSITDSERWSAGSLPRTSRILTDANTQQRLLREGFAASNVIAYSDSLRSTNLLARFDYLISTPMIRSASSLSVSQLGRILDNSITVAVFDEGGHQVEIRQIMSGDPSTFASRRAVDAAARKIAGQGLIVNSHVSADRTPRSVLASGALDLRAATVLAMLAESTPVRVLDLPEDPAESAADMPARIMQVLVQSVPVLTAMIPALPALYRPIRVDQHTDGSTTLIWTPSVAPAPPVT